MGQRSMKLQEAQGRGGRLGRGARAWWKHIEERGLCVSNLAGVVGWCAGCVGEALRWVVQFGCGG